MRMRIDPFLSLIMGAVALASFAPATGAAAFALEWVSKIGIALLFFGHGAALSRSAIVGGMRQWQLHLFIFATTFVVFPLLVFPLNFVPEGWLPRDLVLGFLYLSALPSAISSSIAFTAMAKGNVAVAVCNSAASNVFGLMLTPLLVALLVQTAATGGFDLAGSLRDIVFELLLPFALGQMIHPWIAGLASRHKRRLEQYDQGVIVVIVYAAFSQSVNAGLWGQLPVWAFAAAVGLCMLLLSAILALTIQGARHFGFSRNDEIAAVFCGSKKSLASGLPLAQVLFAGMPGLGVIVLPIMLYNQLQIIIGAIIARRYLHHTLVSRLEA